jgi:hypothetical protein
MFKIKYSILVFISCIFTQTPMEFQLGEYKKLGRYEHNSTKGQLANNAVIDIRNSGDSLYFFGTGNGLSYADILPDGRIDFGYFSISTMPIGGNPALAVSGNIIAVSGVIDTAVATGTEPKGTGIAYSTDRGENWDYLPQPVDPDTVYFEIFPLSSCIENGYDWDSQSETCFSNKNWTIPWGEQEISSLLVSSEVDNVSYDLAIYDGFIYAASWAGGLRRYPVGLLEENGVRKWEVIPLPGDDDLDLYCGQIDNSYYLNPRDPGDGGNHNHKGFSVYVDDKTVWAGTAAGINKGIINGNCIDWVGHYTSLMNNISGDWVIGFAQQNFTDFNRLWAITWAAGTEDEFSALSYTDDGGETWETTQPSGKVEKTYNLYGNSTHIWASSESGLYVSENGKNWEKYLRPIDENMKEELITESVMSSYYSENLDWLWVGTGDGIAISVDDGIKWTVHRFWESTVSHDEKNMFSAYPNPFLIKDYNLVGGDGHVRFTYSNPENYSGTINIFDFSMDKVIQLNNPHLVNNNESEVIWNGRNEYGDQVANGVYFCRLSLNGKYYWTKLAVVN